MNRNILVTGGAGYIGGSVLADLVSTSDELISRAKIIACARTETQTKHLAGLGVGAVVADLTNSKTVSQIIASHEIDIVLHIASSADPTVASNLIEALGSYGKKTHKQTHFINTSGTTAFAPEAGWPDEKMVDTENICETEKRISMNHPIRMTNMAVTEDGEKHGVTTFIAVVSSVYGRGTGPVKKLSIGVPTFVRTSIRDKMVHKFNKNGDAGAVHVSDLTAFYRLFLHQILRGAELPSGKEGYYFAVAHTISSWSLMQGLAERLHAKGLVEEAIPREWSSDEAAAASIGAPVQIVRIMGTHNTKIIPKKPYELFGWQPRWTEEAFLESLDAEIEAVLELDEQSW